MRISSEAEFFQALATAPSHSIATSIEWEDRVITCRRTKRYVVSVTQLAEEEALRRFNRTNAHHEYLLISFAGELSPAVRAHLSPIELERGFKDPYPYSEGFLLDMAAMGASLFNVDWMPI